MRELEEGRTSDPLFDIRDFGPWRISTHVTPLYEREDDTDYVYVSVAIKVENEVTGKIHGEWCVVPKLDEEIAYNYLRMVCYEWMGKK